MSDPQVALALRYVDYLRTGDEDILAEAFSSDHWDHVSGQRSVEIMRTVRRSAGGSRRASLTSNTRSMA